MFFPYVRIYAFFTGALIALICLFIVAGISFNNREHYLEDIYEYHYLLDDALEYYDTCRFVGVQPFSNNPSYYCRVEIEHPIFSELTYSGNSTNIYSFIIHVQDDKLYYGDFLSYFGYPDNERLFHSRNGYMFQWNWLGNGGLTVYGLNSNIDRYDHYHEITMLYAGREFFEQTMNNTTP